MTRLEQRLLEWTPARRRAMRDFVGEVWDELLERGHVRAEYGRITCLSCGRDMRHSVGEDYRGKSDAALEKTLYVLVAPEGPRRRLPR